MCKYWNVWEKSRGKWKIIRSKLEAQVRKWNTRRNEPLVVLLTLWIISDVYLAERTCISANSCVYQLVYIYCTPTNITVLFEIGTRPFDKKITKFLFLYKLKKVLFKFEFKLQIIETSARFFFIQKKLIETFLKIETYKYSTIEEYPLNIHLSISIYLYHLRSISLYSFASFICVEIRIFALN